MSIQATRTTALAASTLLLSPSEALGWGFDEVKRFAWAYVKSMRLYYAFVTGIAGWIGVSYYNAIASEGIDPLRASAVLTVLFLSWGINQIVNDYMGIEEDRVNAPHRPMVTGELHPQAALSLSIALLAGTAVLSWFLNPWCLLPLAAGVLLNVLYEYSKAWSLLGNVIFGAAITNCTLYGFLAVGPLPDPLVTGGRICALFFILFLNGLMTYYTYFKDYEGDRKAGKATFIVRHGLEVARYAGLAGAFLPSAAFIAALTFGWLSWEATLFNANFMVCALVTVLLQVWTGILYFRHPAGESTYRSLSTNFRACVAGQATLIAAFNGGLALALLGASYVGIGILFGFHRDAKA